MARDGLMPTCAVLSCDRSRWGTPKNLQVHHLRATCSNECTSNIYLAGGQSFFSIRVDSSSIAWYRDEREAR